MRLNKKAIHNAPLIREYLKNVRDNRLKKLALEAISDPNMLESLAIISLHDPKPISFRAVWVLREVSRKSKESFKEEFLQSVCAELSINTSDNIIGLYFKIFAEHNLDISSCAHIIDLCIHHVRKKSDISYNRAYALEFLNVIVDQAPEIKPEIQMLLEQTAPLFDKLYVIKVAKRLSKKLINS